MLNSNVRMAAALSPVVGFAYWLIEVIASMRLTR